MRKNVSAQESNTALRAVRLGEYIIETGATVRQAAKVFGISKSTVHKDVTERLHEIDAGLHDDVALVLARNKAERHIRGGAATREKYLGRAEYSCAGKD